MKIPPTTTMLAGFSLFAGALIGLRAVVLIAPRSGLRTRRKIKIFFEDAGEQFDEKRTKAKRSVRRLINRISSSCRFKPQDRVRGHFRLSPGWLNHHSK